MSKTITSAILNVVTSYDTGAGNTTTTTKPWAVVSLNDLRLYEFYKLGALSLFGAYGKFELSQPVITQPVAWPTQTSYAKATYSIPLIPLPAQATVGGSPEYIPGSTATTAAYDAATTEALLQSLVVSALAYSSETVITPATDGLGTASLKVYACYIDVTFDDASTHRYWASGSTELQGGKWGNGAANTPAPGTPTGTLNADYATDESDTTFAEIQETNRAMPNGLYFSALWNPAKLVLDWALHILCGDPPDGSVGAAYSYAFTVKGGTPPYSMSVTGGEFPPGLTLATDGGVSGVPTNEGTYSFTLTATDSGSTDVLVDTAQAGGAGMSMATLTPDETAQATASTSAYMGLNALNYPYYAIAVAVAPPITPVVGVDSYMVTAQACTPSGTPSGSEKDFYGVSSMPTDPIEAQTLLAQYATDMYTAVRFRLYSVSSGVRTLISTAWAGSSSQIVDAGAVPTAPGSSMPTFPTSVATVAQASTPAIYMGTNSLSQKFWSIAVAVAPQGTDVYEITAQVTDASGTADPSGTEKDFFLVEYPRVAAFPSQNLLGTYQSDPASTYTYITFKMYVLEPDGSRTLTPAWNGSADHVTVPFGPAPADGTVPAALPPMMTDSVICSITIGSGVLTAGCGTPGIVTLGTAFTFRPPVYMGSVLLDSTYDADGTITWLVTGLPPGLIWDYTVGSGTYGSIAGVATQPGTFIYTAVITSSDGQVVTLTCTLQVEGSGFSEACGTPPTAAQGLPFAFAPPFADGTDWAGWTFTSLPPGLNWDSASGQILGVPTQLGTFVYTATLGDSSFVCSITVVAAGDSGPGACGGPAVLLVGIPFQFTPPFTAAAPPTAWTFTGLAPGLGWDTDSTSLTYGSIAGIPSAPGGYAYHATATVDGAVLSFTCTFVVQLPGDPGDGANDGGGKGACWWLDLFVWQPVFGFQVLNQEFQMPPAYQRALRYTLARELAGVYGRDPSIVAALAAEAVAEIDAMNVSNAAGTEDPPPPPQPPVVVPPR